MKPLHVLLERRFIKVAALAREAGIPPTTLYKYISGTGDVFNMGVQTFMRLAHALGMTSEELFDELRAIEAGDTDGHTA
jgi:predicted transcriptional regulator